uniref:hypothetical protein n=1 Tax=Campylobacter jejuni TaxID=197 RepID=UPI00057629D2
NSKVETLVNNGVLKGTGTDVQHGGILVASSVTNITNNKTIEGKNGIVVRNGGKVGTIINENSITGVANGIYLNNATIGSIINRGTIQGSNTGTIMAALMTSGSTVDNFNNSGFMSGIWGIAINDNGRINTLINTGTIIGEEGGIDVSYGKYGDIEIKEGGKVIGITDNAIQVGQWQTMGALTIEGKNTEVIGKMNGLYIGVGSQSTTINIKDRAKLLGEEAGIYVDFGTLSGSTVIDNATVHGNIAGIYFSRKSELKGTLE